MCFAEAVDVAARRKDRRKAALDRATAAVLPAYKQVGDHDPEPTQSQHKPKGDE